MTSEKGHSTDKKHLVAEEFPHPNLERVLVDIYSYAAIKLAGQALKVTVDFVPQAEFADSNEHVLTMFDAFPAAELAAKQAAVAAVGDHLSQQLLRQDLAAQNSNGLQEVLEALAANDRMRELPRD